MLWSSAEGQPPPSEVAGDCLYPQWSPPALTTNTVPLSIYLHVYLDTLRTNAPDSNVATWHSVIHSLLQLNSIKYSPTLFKALKIQEWLNPSPVLVGLSLVDDRQYKIKLYKYHNRVQDAIRSISIISPCLFPSYHLAHSLTVRFVHLFTVGLSPLRDTRTVTLSVWFTTVSPALNTDLGKGTHSLKAVSVERDKQAGKCQELWALSPTERSRRCFSDKETPGLGCESKDHTGKEWGQSRRGERMSKGKKWHQRDKGSGGKAPKYYCRPVVLKEGWFCALGGMQECLETFLIVLTWGSSCSWQLREARDAAKQPTTYRTAPTPTTENYLTYNVSSAEV